MVSSYPHKLDQHANIHTQNHDNYTWQADLDVVRGKTFHVVFNAKEDNYEVYINFFLSSSDTSALNCNI